MNWTEDAVDRLNELKHRHWRAHLPADYQPLHRTAAQQLPLDLCERDHAALHQAIMATYAGILETGIALQATAHGQPDQWLVEELEAFRQQCQGWHFDGRHWWPRCASVFTTNADQLELPIG